MLFPSASLFPILPRKIIHKPDDKRVRAGLWRPELDPWRWTQESVRLKEDGSSMLLRVGRRRKALQSQGVLKETLAVVRWCWARVKEGICIRAATHCQASHVPLEFLGCGWLV